MNEVLDNSLEGYLLTFFGTVLVGPSVGRFKVQAAFDTATKAWLQMDRYHDIFYDRQLALDWKLPMHIENSSITALRDNVTLVKKMYQPGGSIGTPVPGVYLKYRESRWSIGQQEEEVGLDFLDKRQTGAEWNCRLSLSSKELREAGKSHFTDVIDQQRSYLRRYRHEAGEPIRLQDCQRSRLVSFQPEREIVDDQLEAQMTKLGFSRILPRLRHVSRINDQWTINTTINFRTDLPHGKDKVHFKLYFIRVDRKLTFFKFSAELVRPVEGGTRSVKDAFPVFGYPAAISRWEAYQQLCQQLGQQKAQPLKRPRSTRATPAQIKRKPPG